MIAAGARFQICPPISFGDGVLCLFYRFSFGGSYCWAGVLQYNTKTVVPEYGKGEKCGTLYSFLACAGLSVMVCLDVMEYDSIKV